MTDNKSFIKTKNAIINYIYDRINELPDYNKAVLSTVLKFPLVGGYYEADKMCCVIPINDLNENISLKDEVLGLLKEGSFKDNEGSQRNWVLGYVLDDGIDSIFLRPVVSSK